MFSSNTTQASDGGYQISRSLRFNSADSAYLNRSLASSGNQQKFTFSYWFKRGAISTQQVAFGLNSGGNEIFTLAFLSGDTLRVFARNGGTDVLNLTTTAVYRDPSAWYHIVVAIDTTQATSSNRALMYVNGVQVTAFGTATYPAQNTNLVWNNSAYSHQIGREDTGNYLNGYLTETNFIDGQALTPSSFGYTDPNTGVWSPLAFVGTYGTNGFYLNFSDNSNTTAATLGKDYSGNGNNWTPNNFSVTAGVGNDSMVDVPTPYGVDTGVGGTVRGNYCTLSPISSGGTMSNGNLDGVSPVDTANNATFAIPASGKWYFEAVMTNAGILNLGLASYRPLGHIYNNTNSVLYSSSGKKNVDNVLDQNYGASFTTGDIIGVACDADAGTITFYKNNTSQGALTHQIGGLFPSFGNGGTSTNYTVNFGQRPFAYTAPSGFKALVTQNLPTPTIGATTATQAGKYFNTILWSGTGSGTTRSLTGVGFQPDWVWTKSRSNSYEHQLYDAVRGAGNTKSLSSNSINTEAMGNVALYGYVSSFDSDGFTGTKGSDATLPYAYINESGRNYVAWNWKANGAGSTNTSGSITSTVSASTISGFSVVTYTGTGSAGTIGHGLGVAPSMIIVKSRSVVTDWPVYSITTGNGNYLVLNKTDASAASSTMWNATSPTNSVFSVGTNTTSNTVSGTYVAYCFAPIAGYSAFGSYTGNGLTDGPFVFTGFRPAYVLYKGSSTSGGAWDIHDDTRSPSNEAVQTLFANTAGAEGGVAIDILSNGFKVRDTSANVNGSGVTYIFAAFAETPLKYSLAR